MCTQCVIITYVLHAQLPDIRPPSCHYLLLSERNTRIFRLAAETLTRCLGSARNSAQTLNTTQTLLRGQAAVVCSPLCSGEGAWWRYCQTRGYLSPAMSSASFFRSTTFWCCDWMKGRERGPRWGPIRGGRVAVLVQSEQGWGLHTTQRPQPVQLLHPHAYLHSELIHVSHVNVSYDQSNVKRNIFT